MEPNAPVLLVSRPAMWFGYTLTGFAALQMFASVAAKLLLPAGVQEHFAELGWKLSDVRGLAVLELACTLAYLFPRTSVWGAILLTAYLGGATAAHVRIDDVVFLYPVSLGVMLWVGLLVRAPRLRAMLSRAR
jgi:hypothetical protein